MTDQGFPLIDYDPNKTYIDWGHAHGEQFREGIKELVQIRKELMLAKNPSIASHLDELAHAQWNETQKFAPHIIEELKGIYQGAGVSLTDITILNNYTDFRDLTLPDEGCSTIHIQKDHDVYSGQTWDMHGSAKNYVCLIKSPEKEGHPSAVSFSLVGCVGMMGVNSNGCLVGVNNINTQNARAGLIWPVLVRKLLTLDTFEAIRTQLINSPVTSGHNYIISSNHGGAHVEVTPHEHAIVSSALPGDTKAIFHTNHCLGEEIIKVEDQTSVSSTTHIRYEILERKAEKVQSYQELIQLLTDHENFPKSICSHFESGAQDPSFTCGGGAADLTKLEDLVCKFWRGCEEHDDNYRELSFSLEKTESGRQFVLQS